MDAPFIPAAIENRQGIVMDVEVNGLGQLESPRWHEGQLWYADWTAGAIRTLSGARTTEVKIEHRSLPLCFDFLPDGTLVIASGPERAILKASPGGALIRYADLSGLSPYGSNDIVADGRGNIYVNNVNFDFAAGPPEGEPAPGFVALVTPDGEVGNVARDLSFPNGMAVTADNSTLVVAESYRHRLTAFDIGADGSLANRRVWAEVGHHSPDGICLDAEGSVWYADVGDRCCVRVSEGGEVLDRVQLDRGAFACMLGGDDRSTLFVCAAQWPGVEHFQDQTAWDGTIFSAPTPVAGVGWPGD
jgi:sugar lactone lactonase YvrE